MQVESWKKIHPMETNEKKQNIQKLLFSIHAWENDNKHGWHSATGLLRKTARPDGIYMDRRGMITHLIMVACAYLLLPIRGLIA